MREAGIASDGQSRSAIGIGARPILQSFSDLFSRKRKKRTKKAEKARRVVLHSLRGSEEAKPVLLCKTSHQQQKMEGDAQIVNAH